MYGQKPKVIIILLTVSTVILTMAGLIAVFMLTWCNGELQTVNY